MNTNLRVLVLFLVACALPAQGELSAKSFLPDDHRNVVCVDFAAMRDRGIWDEVEVSVLKLAFASIEKEMAFRLRDLDRLTMVAQPGEDRAAPRRDVRVVVIEGNKPLGVPESIAQNWVAEAIGKHEVRRRNDVLFVQPRPELRVEGRAALIEPVLAGKPYAGMPCPDVMSLLSARKDRLLYLVADVANPLLRKELLDSMFEGTTWPDGDAPSFLCLQLLAAGEVDDPHLAFEAVVRHAKEGPGLEVTERAVAALLERLGKEPALHALRPALRVATTRRDRGDVIVSAELGRARHAVGSLATLVVTYMLTPVSLEAAASAPAAPAPVPAPVPEAPKKQ